MSDRPFDQDRDLDEAEHDDATTEPDAPVPETMENALATIAQLRRALAGTRGEARDRRVALREAERRLAELEDVRKGEVGWRSVAVRALIESEAARQRARRPALLTRLVDLAALDGETEEELRLHVTEAVQRTLEEAPELRAPAGAGVRTPGVRTRLDQVRDPHGDDASAWLRRAARRA